ncbi:response regulator transcription factor [Sphaerobacter thermophilus]|jgi:DNA-binding NarL/FixJ family response regulator|uniref:Two component transcriptional regulator, LuxR family n=1 Tax=Sphaerobacter thermophilus (strain ATCC 49802 / DSM 20745 / KCCM 41009 / NCIMB 13125 / S 6022) TaxID=479434 RepID=D1C9Z8_SPHTD|nr:response regulator transcription factor [Sphaerobacter thermophilus]ACZ40641.1 two component transcriptional regulator, LuxR family [Sphaerobacter thermophilus DSM 20745]PZN67549.1 MAG: DNA-binding response regulator [Sphaerobacter thermophilus]
MIRILVVDDHPVVREGLVAILEAQEDLTVVGEAGDGDQAVQQYRDLKPDVVLMDLAMPGTDGVQAIQEIKRIDPNARVVVLTAYDTDERILQAVQAGASGYLLKGAPREDIFRAVRVVYRGGSLLEPVVAGKLLNRMGDLLRGEPVEEELTARELDVLTLMARGLRNKEIAYELSITERTVKFHANAIYRKLDVSGRTEAVSKAIQRGLVRP